MSHVPPAHAPKAAARTVILVLVGLVFAVPILSMVEFTLRGGLAGGYTLDRWIAVFSGQLDASYRPIWTGLANSALLAVITVLLTLAILVPTLILVQLRFPFLRRAVEFLCLLPISVPAIVLVVGLAPVYSVVARIFGSGVWPLSFAYGITVLPFAYRAIQSNLDAFDAKTLSEAARSLGAGWITVFLRVLLPSLRRGVLAAAIIALAVVLGEYTIASLLNRVNLQTALVLISKNDPFTAVIFALLALIFVGILLFVLGRVGSGTAGSGRTPKPPRAARRPRSAVAAATTPTPSAPLVPGASS
ncbi:ABC transporter permease [Naasia lichenicola]|uniref:ABC transporter permease subunit n=1 Tax=Naasia lichenicola TaxID=2565933 RepID=A0A4S4FP41_9MICO|nr:ABC transporter permease subunit [Naasia lichenicola]THG32313.1 ABC transporter permease subunit [Naasia lichenicola]